MRTGLQLPTRGELNVFHHFQGEGVVLAAKFGVYDTHTRKAIVCDMSPQCNDASTGEISRDLKKLGLTIVPTARLAGHECPMR